MSRPEGPDRNEQTLAAMRAAAAPLVAIGRDIPPMEDRSVQADSVALAHLRWLVADAGRALVVRQAALSRTDRADIAVAVLDAEYPDQDLDAAQLPDGGPPRRVRTLQPVGPSEERELVDRFVQPLVELHAVAAAMDSVFEALGAPGDPEGLA